MNTQQTTFTPAGDASGGFERSADRRGAGRVPVRMLVEYADKRDFVTDYTANMNLGGMFIRTEAPLALGTRFQLRFQVQGRAEPIDTTATVRWSQPATSGGALYAGMGVQFDALSEADEDAVFAMLESFNDWD